MAAIACHHIRPNGDVTNRVDGKVEPEMMGYQVQTFNVWFSLAGALAQMENYLREGMGHEFPPNVKPARQGTEPENEVLHCMGIHGDSAGTQKLISILIFCSVSMPS